MSGETTKVSFARRGLSIFKRAPRFSGSNTDLFVFDDPVEEFGFVNEFFKVR
jgi:hypothetical protein